MTEIMKEPQVDLVTHSERTEVSTAIMRTDFRHHQPTSIEENKYKHSRVIWVALLACISTST